MAKKIKPKVSKKGGLERKQKYLKKLKHLMEEYSKILVVTADFVGSNQMQQIRKILRDYNAVLVMGKNSVMKKEVSDCMTLDQHHNVQNLIDVIKGNVGLVFTNGDLKEVKDSVEKFKALNIPTKINKGAIEIIDDVDLIKKGENVGNSEAALLSKLNIMPFSYGLVTKNIYESGYVYAPQILDMTEDDVAERFAMGVTNISAFAMSLSYPSLSLVPHMIVNGFKNVLPLSLATHYTLSLAPHPNHYHKDPVPIAAPAVTTTSKIDVTGEEQGMSSDVGKPKPKLPSSLILERQQQSREGQSQVSLPDVKDVASDEEDDTPDNHMLVQPMYQIFSITINHYDFDRHPYPKMLKIMSLDDGISCQVFGLVRVFVQNGKTFDIYHRNKDNPEFVKFGGFLSIDGFPILQLGAIKVAVYLFDLAHHIQIANEIIDVDCHFIHDYDRVLVTEARGEYGFASIHHSIFQHAISANIENMVLKQVCDSGIDVRARLHGTVSAHLERSYASDVQEFPPSILFDNRETTECVQFGTDIDLFRTCVIVPAFYSLRIKATFKDESGRDVCRDTKLSVRHEGLTEKCGKGPNCEMKLVVKWSSMLDEVATRPILQVSGAKQLPAHIASAKPMMFPCVEVFSISLCLDKKVADVSGSVEIRDSSHTFVAFNDEQNWYYGDSLDLKAPPFSFDDEPFKVNISLVDEQKCVASKGRLEWDFSEDDDPMLHDRFLCSIIRGDIGYAAINYLMITYAVQAEIVVRFISHCHPNSVVRVRGSITAEYGNYNYSCSYNQEYYKSRLFFKPEDDDVEVEIGSDSRKYKLPLVKSLIAVPLDDMLLINLSLKVIGPGQKVTNVEEIMKFKINGGSTCAIYKEDYAICVDATWNYLRQYPGDKYLS